MTGDDGERIAAGTFQGTAAPADMIMTAAVPLRGRAGGSGSPTTQNRVVLDHTLPPPKT